MVLPSDQLEAAWVILRLQHYLVSVLFGLAVYRKIEICLSDYLLLSIVYHVDLKLRLWMKKSFMLENGSNRKCAYLQAFARID